MLSLTSGPTTRCWLCSPRSSHSLGQALCLRYRPHLVLFLHCMSCIKSMMLPTGIFTNRSGQGMHLFGAGTVLTPALLTCFWGSIWCWHSLRSHPSAHARPGTHLALDNGRHLLGAYPYRARLICLASLRQLCSAPRLGRSDLGGATHLCLCRYWI